MQQSLFVSEILGLRNLKILNQKLKEVGEIVWDLVLARLTDVADSRD